MNAYFARPTIKLIAEAGEWKRLADGIVRQRAQHRIVRVEAARERHGSPPWKRREIIVNHEARDVMRGFVRISRQVTGLCAAQDLQ